MMYDYFIAQQKWVCSGERWHFGLAIGVKACIEGI